MRIILLLGIVCALDQASLYFAQSTIIVPDDQATIQAGIDATIDGDTVLVRPGTYLEAIDFRGKAIKVVSESSDRVTTIDAQFSAPAVRFVNGEGCDSRLIGFTITKGVGYQSYDGGGITCAESIPASPVITDCIIENCATDQMNFQGVNGAGVGGGSPTLIRCVIRDNFSTVWGGGVSGSPNLKECVIADNLAVQYGGGLYLGDDSTMEDCIVVGNLTLGSSAISLSRGGGAYVYGENVNISSCVFYDNKADSTPFLGDGLGGALYVSGLVTQPPTLSSCTIVENSKGANGFNGGLGGDLSMVNCILRNNEDPPGFYAAETDFTYSNVEGGAAGIGVIDQVPVYVNSNRADFHLKSTSPEIDAGDPTTFDPDGSVADMGAFPFQSLYVRKNLLPATWSAPTWSSISSDLGGQVRLRIIGDSSESGANYQVLGSLSGTSPGTPAFGTSIPLNLDSYLLQTLAYPNDLPLMGGLGILSEQGIADMRFVLNLPLAVSLAGSTGHHAAAVFRLNPLEIRFTNPVPFSVDP